MRGKTDGTSSWNTFIKCNIFVDENELKNLNKEQTHCEGQSYENQSCLWQTGNMVYIFARQRSVQEWRNNFISSLGI